MILILASFISKFGDSGRWLLEFWAQGPLLCRSALPATPLRPLYEAMICGVRLPAGADRQLFIDTGLIHLMVVSGAHLAFLESALGFLPRRVRLCGLGLFCFFTGFQPPILRAFFRRIFGARWVREKALSPLQIEAGLVLVCLILMPGWIQSRSFLMTWMAGIALSSPAWIPQPRILDWALKCYVFLLPFSWASPVGISWNVTVAPLIGILLFPASLLALIFHPLILVSDFLWRLVLAALHLGPHGTPWPIFWATRSLILLPLITHILFLVMEVRWRRKSAFSS